MEILYELVTVIRELTPLYHWETGKMADAMVYKKPRSLSRETCLNVVRKLLFQATSNWLYVLHLQDMPDRRFAGLFCVESFTVADTAVEDFFRSFGMEEEK